MSVSRPFRYHPMVVRVGRDVDLAIAIYTFHETDPVRECDWVRYHPPLWGQTTHPIHAHQHIAALYNQTDSPAQRRAELGRYGVARGRDCF